MKADVKYGFFVGIGLLAAVVVWHLLGRAGGKAAGIAGAVSG